MSRPLEGRTVALAEGRQLEELVGLLDKEGVQSLRCPMLGIRDAPESAPVKTWLRELAAGKFALVVLMTGEGVRRLVDLAEREGIREPVVRALGRTRTLTRGPKPGQALKELGFTAAIVAEVPTTEGVLAKLRGEALAGQAVGVQLAGGPNPELTEGLEAAGARVYPVVPYVYAPAANAEEVACLIRRLAGGEVDVLLFTSAPQVDRLYAVAEAEGLQTLLTDGLRKTKVAAVGPVVADRLRERGHPADICPEQGFVMKNLVQHIKRAFGRDS